MPSPSLTTSLMIVKTSSTMSLSLWFHRGLILLLFGGATSQLRHSRWNCELQNEKRTYAEGLYTMRTHNVSHPLYPHWTASLLSLDSLSTGGRKCSIISRVRRVWPRLDSCWNRKFRLIYGKQWLSGGCICEEVVQGGTRTEKKDRTSIFFVRPTEGLSTYVIKHHSKYGNMMTSPHSLSAFAWHLACCANPVPWGLVKVYTTKVILEV